MSNTITKKILIDRIAESTDMKRVAVKQVVQEFLEQVIVELGEGNRLEFRDFGVFEVKERAPRIAQNPKTLERVPVPAKRTVKFKVGRRMREAMDQHDGPGDADRPAI
ncbi:MAG: HU family DNA-binding protein, partial [Phycisphaerales bacterium]